jgi:hypothetical protein
MRKIPSTSIITVKAKAPRLSPVRLLSSSSRLQFLVTGTVMVVLLLARTTSYPLHLRAADSGLPSLSSSQHLSTNMAIKAGDLVTTVPGSLSTMISDGKRSTTGNIFYDKRTSASNLHK